MPIGAQTLDAATGERSSVTVLNTVLGAKLPQKAVIEYEGGGLSIATMPSYGMERGEAPDAHELCPKQGLISQDSIVVGMVCLFPDYSDGSAWLDRIQRRYGDPTEVKHEFIYLWKSPTTGISAIRLVLFPEGYSSSIGLIGWFSTEAPYESMEETLDAIKTANESDLAF